MNDTHALLIGLVMGTIGMGYCLYGKKQRNAVAFGVGVLLMGLPYIIDNNKLLIAISIVLILLPKYIKL